MPSESGDMKLLGNFRILLDQVSADVNYKPANPALLVTALQTQYAAALAAVNDVSAELAPNRLATGERATAFEAMSNSIMRSRNLLKASGVSPEIMADAETSVRKILGRRKTPKAKPPVPAPETPETAAPEASKNHSASQLSFDNQLGHLGAYLELLTNVHTYSPNEPDLKLTALRNMAADLKDKNDTVSSTFAPLSQARGLRDQLLYESPGCVVNTALLVKAYVSGAMGTNSPLYKQIKGLAFKRKPQG